MKQGPGKGGCTEAEILEYIRVCTPENIHAVCEDYRAAMGIVLRWIRQTSTPVGRSPVRHWCFGDRPVIPRTITIRVSNGPNIVAIFLTWWRCLVGIIRRNRLPTKLTSICVVFSRLSELSRYIPVIRYAHNLVIESNDDRVLAGFDVWAGRNRRHDTDCGLRLRQSR
jgi:hypothetical protein